MGKEKGGFLSPKQIANRIKAKGLQKLRWYCEMCQKQCRDENGFKCHTMSESHQRQLLLVADNPEKYVDDFSQQFCDDFLEVLRLKCGTKRIQANNVYQDYIGNRTHTHMNATQWETLTEFVKWMGREGKCVVDETEKGWFIQLIDRKPETIQRQIALEKMVKMEADDTERNHKLLQRQIERAAQTETNHRETIFTELQKQNDDEKVCFKFDGAKSKDHSSVSSTNPDAKPVLSQLDEKIRLKTSALNSDRDGVASSSSSSSDKNKKRKLTALDEIIQMEEQFKEKKGRKSYWLHEGIIVKVLTKQHGEKYHKKKGIVKEVVDRYTGVVQMFDSSETIRVDQIKLQTVLPALHKTVLIVNGAYRGEKASLMSIDEKNFCCSVTIQSGVLKDRTIDKVQYEDVCKLYQTDE